MVKYVRVYIEGGAKGKTADRDFRRGWKKFLNELHELARNHGFQGLEVIRGTGRGQAFHHFLHYRPEYEHDLRVLLVDSEMAVPEGRNVWDIVARRVNDPWRRPKWATERNLYLMAHFVETWLLTDRDALQQFFNRGFNPAGLPNTDLENRPKDEIDSALVHATRLSSKGPYKHGQSHEIIALVSPDRVKTLSHGRRLFNTLGSLIRNEPEM